MKTANEQKSGIFATDAILLRGSNYAPPEVQKVEEAVALFRGGHGSGPHPGGGKNEDQDNAKEQAAQSADHYGSGKEAHAEQLTDRAERPADCRRPKK